MTVMKAAGGSELMMLLVIASCVHCSIPLEYDFTLSNQYFEAMLPPDHTWRVSCKPDLAMGGPREPDLPSELRRCKGNCALLARWLAPRL